MNLFPCNVLAAVHNRYMSLSGDRDTEREYSMLHALKKQIDYFLQADPPMKYLTPKELAEYKAKFPDSHFIIGDFAVKCLNPDRYKY